jgi:CheY-like chemotaxis protein
MAERDDHCQDRRRFPRYFMDLPLEFQILETPNVYQAHGGIVVNGSETGFLMQTLRDMALGTRIDLKVLFPEGFRLADFDVKAEVMWRDVLEKEEWRGFEYGLRILQVKREDFLKLRAIIREKMEESRSEGVTGRKILVVDDDEKVRRFIRALLERWGFEVEEAGDGAEAIDVVGREAFDLLILDLVMPVMDGWQVLGAVKSDPRTEEIPVIVLTGISDQETMIKGYDRGVSYFITKPFTSSQLLYGIRLMLGLEEGLPPQDA